MNGNLAISGKGLEVNGKPHTVRIGSRNYHRDPSGPPNAEGVRPIILQPCTSRRDLIAPHPDAENANPCACLEPLLPAFLWSCVQAVGEFLKDLWERIFPSVSANPVDPSLPVPATLKGTLTQITYPCSMILGMKIVVPTEGKSIFTTVEYKAIYASMLCRHYSKHDLSAYQKQRQELDAEITPKLKNLPKGALLHCAFVIFTQNPKTPNSYGYVVEESVVAEGNVTQDLRNNEIAKSKIENQQYNQVDIQFLLDSVPALSHHLKVADIFHKSGKLRSSSLHPELRVKKI